MGLCVECLTRAPALPRVTTKRAGAPDVILVVASDVERNAVSFLTDVRQGARPPVSRANSFYSACLSSCA